jgi:3-oxoacyl-[acyl-carrier-protein] synthase I
MTNYFYLSALGIACSLGHGKKAVADALFKGKEAVGSTHTLFSGRQTFVHELPFNLPPLPAGFSDLDSRNNALLRLALDEIAHEVQGAIDAYGASRVAVVMATSTSGMKEGEMAFSHKLATGIWPENYEFSKQEVASPSMFTSRYFQIQGPAYTISTACTSGTKALCSARRLIKAGICDAVIVGGVDTLCDMTLNGFDSLCLLSPDVCQPFSKTRQGITLGDGAAVFLMTKDQLSDSPIEFLGGGETSDAYHVSSPDPSGKGSQGAIKAALEMADLQPEDMAYINLHGTATLLNDLIESQCVHELFGDRVPCGSTKALTGHTLGASGAIGAAFLWLSLWREQGGSIPLPPHVWDGEQDPDLSAIRLVGHQERAKPIGGHYALMSNSFAFGGSNASVILGKKGDSYD